MRLKNMIILLALVSFLVAVPVVVQAADVSGTCGEGTSWALDGDGVLTISGSGAMDTYAYGSAPWYEHREAITAVVVEDTVTQISEGAFHGLCAVEEMTLPFVGDKAKDYEQYYQYPFGYIFGTESYDGSVETAQRFYRHHIEELDSGTYYVPGSLRSVTITGGNILAGAFYNCIGLTDITLPEGTKWIREGAFSKCRSLTSIQIPEGVECIWKSAFSACVSLSQVSIPESVTRISSSAFRGCTSLTQIVIPKNVTAIDSYAFTGCSGLEEVIFCGDAPERMNLAFSGITVTAYYPCYNETWTADVMLDYGGTVTWVAYDPDITVPTLDLWYPSVSFEDAVVYNIYYTATDLEDVKEMGVLTFHERLTEGTIEDAVQIQSGYSTDGSAYMVQIGGTGAAQMGDTVYFKVYARLSDGSYAYSDVQGYSVVEYAKTILARQTSSDQLKALLVAVLNYGAEAQRYFGHDTDSLMNGFLTEDQQALVAAYDETMMDPIEEATASKTAGIVRESYAYGQCGATASFDSAFALNFYFTATLDVDEDEGMTLYYWDKETYDSWSRLYTSRATGTVTMTHLGDGRYWGQISGIAAKDMDETLYVAAYYDSDTVGYSTGVISYSMGRYCEGIAANDSSQQQALAQATAVYGYYAKLYFAG